MTETGRAASVFEIRLVPVTRDKNKNLALHLIAGAVVVIWAVVAIVIGGISGLIGLHQVVVTERGTGRVVLKGNVPALEGERLVGLMTTDTNVMTADEFLQKWSDVSEWAFKIQNSKGGK